MADVPILTGLSEYLASISGRRWRPGVLDCGMFMADWVIRCGFADPISDIRGTYRSAAEFNDIIEREGGFLDCADARLTSVGLRAGVAPQPGDIIAVNAPYASGLRRPTGAIAVDTDRRAVLTLDKGLVIASGNELPILRTWSRA